MSGSEVDEPLTRLIAQGDALDPIEERQALEAVQAQLFDATFAPLALGRYVVLGPVGAGGGGVVYRAYDPELHRRVAVKVLHTGGAQADEARSRLLREAQAIAKLSHPNIVAVYDVGELEGEAALGQGVFMVMELVEGQTLAQWLDADRERPWQEVIRVFADAGRGLAAAHERELVHRDFKPGNVLVGDDGRVRVLDFGLARHRTNAGEGELNPVARAWSVDPVAPDSTATPELLGTDITGAGAVLGTPSYMAPEQHAGEEADARSDQYAFCVALWQGLYGTRPFDAKSLDELEKQKRAGPPRLPSTSPRGRIPRWVSDALVRGLGAESTQRFDSMNDLLAQLGREEGRGRVRAVQLGVLGAAAVTVALALGTRPEAPACDATAIDGLWDEAMRTRARAAFEATNEPYAKDAWASAEAALAGFAETWRSEKEATCVAAREEPGPGVALRELCLDRDLESFGEVGRLLADADAQVVRNAVAATSRLPDSTRCRDAAGDLHRLDIAEGERARLRELDAELLRARVHLDAGKYDETKRACASVLGKLQEGDDPAIEARAHLLQCEVQYLDDRDDQALEQCELALAAAERGADQRLVVEAATWLGRTLSALGRHDEAQGVFSMTRARLGGLPAEARDPHLEARLELAIGLTLDSAWKPDEAEPHLERALALHEEIFGERHPELISVLNGLAMMTGGRGDLERAATRYERALTLSREAYGAQHPTSASLLNNLAGVERRRGESQASFDHLRAVLEAKEAVNGPNSPRLVSTLNNLGRALVELERADEAIAYHQRALELMVAHKGEESATLVPSLAALGRAQARTGACDEALPTLERAAELLSGQPKAGEDSRYEVPLERGRCTLESDAEAARVHFERALEEVKVRPGAGTRQHAKTLAEFARWQRVSGDEKGARASLEQALEIAGRTQGDPAFVEQLQAALNARPDN